MSLLDTILSAGGGTAVQELGARLGLGSQQTTSALSALIPALATGVHRNAQTKGGLTSLMAALTNGEHHRYLDDPSALRDPATIDDGNAILGHILGSKAISRRVANKAATESGVGADVLKKMLPMAATLVMGTLAQQATRPSSTSASAQALEGFPDLGGLLRLKTGRSSQVSGVSSVVHMLGKR